METKEQIRKKRELKFERVLLYAEWEERCVEEAHWSWEQWLKIRKLRKTQEKSRTVITYKEDFVTTSFGAKIIKHKYCNEGFNDYIQRLEKEFYILNEFNTVELLYAYLHRDRSINSVKKYLSESYRYVLNTREHIDRKNRKTRARIKHSGKKDRNNGRKNPTNRK